MELWNNLFHISKDREFGFFIQDDLIKFYIPEQLINENKEENFLYLKKYSEILKRYTKTTINRENYYNSLQYDIDNNNLEVITSYLSLIEDYITNGTFYLFEKFYKKGDKRINWNKTLKENNIIITSQSEIVYNSFYTKNIHSNNYNQFYILYLEALRRAKLYLLGWSYEDKLNYPKDINEQKYHLNKYGEEHFKDREIFIVNHLKNIYLKDKWNNVNESKFDFKYHLKFEHIWQHMISHITSDNHIDVNIEKGLYLKHKVGGINLIQDHFIQIDKSYYLFDSKFYKTYENNVFPDTAELSKQFMYKYLISQQKNIPINEIINIFIFPKNNKNKKEPELFEIHYNEQFPEITIFCIALDVQTIIDLYLNNNNYEKLKQLFNDINNNKENLIEEYRNKAFINKKDITKELSKNNKSYSYTSKKGVLNAKLFLSADLESKGLHILKDSTGYLAKDKNILMLQEELINKNIIKYKGKAMFIFLQNYIFDDKDTGLEFVNGQTNSIKWTQEENMKRKNKKYN